MASRPRRQGPSSATASIPVGTIVLAIIIAWYVAAYRMNAPFQRDQNERSSVTVSHSEFIAQTHEPAEADHARAASGGGRTFGRTRSASSSSSNRSLVYHAWVTLSSTLLGFLWARCSAS